MRKHSNFQTSLENPSIQTHLVLLCCIKRLCIFGPKGAIQICYYYYYYYYYYRPVASGLLCMVACSLLCIYDVFCIVSRQLKKLGWLFVQRGVSTRSGANARLMIAVDAASRRVHVPALTAELQASIDCVKDQPIRRPSARLPNVTVRSTTFSYFIGQNRSLERSTSPRYWPCQSTRRLFELFQQLRNAVQTAERVWQLRCLELKHQ